MNEINIYAKFDYRKLLKKANLCFCKRYKWHYSKTVFAPLNSTYLIAIFKHNIYVSYWDDFTEKGAIERQKIKKFLEENISNMDIFMEYDKNCEIVALLKENNNLL